MGRGIQLKRNTLNRIQIVSLVVGIILIGVLGFSIFKIWGNIQQANQLPNMGKAPNFTMANLEGESVSFDEMNGKVRLVYFFFATCDDVCPVTTQQMKGIQNQLEKKGIFGQDVQFVSITVDPERDTLNVLKAYADKFDADLTGWTFLRPKEQKQAENVIQQFGGLSAELEEGVFTHSDRLFLVDRQGNIREAHLQEKDEVILDGIMTLVNED
jgi:protein SCO1/2